MLYANPYGIMGLVTVATCWALAVVLYRVSMTGSAGRRLSVLLVIEGMVLVTSGYVTLLFTPETFEASWIPTWQKVSHMLHEISDCAMIALYPPFLAAALDTKLTRPFKSRRAQIGLAIGGVVLFATVNLNSFEVGHVILYAAMFSLFAYALVVSIHAWYVSPAGIARTRAGIFAIAFGLRDVCWGFIYAAGIFLIVSGTTENQPDPDFLNVVYAGGTFLAIPLIAYGILRTQLFDIDLRIKWTIKQSTLATLVVTFIFLLTEGADRLLSAELGSFAGLIAAAVVVFFLAPLQRFAEKVASAAMPNTENTPEYAAHRKMQVYEAAVAEAIPDGNISERERALLNSLRDSLGITPADAEALERELLSGNKSQ